MRVPRQCPATGVVFTHYMAGTTLSGYAEGGGPQAGKEDAPAPLEPEPSSETLFGRAAHVRMPRGAVSTPRPVVVEAYRPAVPGAEHGTTVGDSDSPGRQRKGTPLSPVTIVAGAAVISFVVVAAGLRLGSHQTTSVAAPALAPVSPAAAVAPVVSPPAVTPAPAARPPAESAAAPRRQKTFHPARPRLRTHRFAKPPASGDEPLPPTI